MLRYAGENVIFEKKINRASFVKKVQEKFVNGIFMVWCVEVLCAATGTSNKKAYPVNGDIIVLPSGNQVWFQGGTYDKDFKWTQQLWVPYTILK